MIRTNFTALSAVSRGADAFPVLTGSAIFTICARIRIEIQSSAMTRDKKADEWGGKGNEMIHDQACER